MLLVAFAPAASAEDCETYTNAHTHATIPDPTGAAGGDLYLIAPVACFIAWDIVECGGIWVYQESNGIPGLQREDEVEDNTCHGSIRGDTIIL